MKAKARVGARVLLGLIYFVFGLNGFFQFIPIPPMSEEAMAFMGGLASSGYFFPFLKITEITGGALLLANRFVPLALLILAPVTLNIVLFHLFLDPAGLPLPIVMIAIHIWLAVSFCKIFAVVLQAKNEPSC